MKTRADYIAHILKMKLGTTNTPPQPEYADYMTGRYDARLPGEGIADGVKAAMRRSIFVHTNPYAGVKAAMKAQA